MPSRPRWPPAGPRHPEARVDAIDRAAHPGQQVAQRVTGLGRRLRPVADDDRAAGHGREGQEGRGVGEVRLDGLVVRGDRSGRDGPAVGVRVVDGDAAVTQHRDRHLDVGEGRDRLAVVTDVDAVVVAGAREQQRRHELRRRRRVDHDRAARHPALAADGERQRPAPSVIDHDAERGQRGQHLADRPVAHVRVAVERDRAVDQARHRRQEPHDRAGQAAVDIGGHGGRRGERRDRPVVALGVDRRTERGQRPRHQQCVAGPQRSSYDGRPVGERCQNECAVGQRLAPGERDHCVDLTGRHGRGPGVGERDSRRGHDSPQSREPRRLGP